MYLVHHLVMSRKTVQIHLMVDAPTRKAWERAASESGLTLSEWVRIRCNGVQVEAAPPVLATKRAA